MNGLPEGFGESPQRDALLSPPRPNSIFFGRFGLRAGYGIVIVILLWLALYAAGQFLAFSATGVLPQIRAAHAYALAHPGAPRLHIDVPLVPMLPAVLDSVVFCGLLFACFLFSRFEHRPIGAYGLDRYRLRDLPSGAVWGLVVLSALVAVLRAFHLVVFDGRALAGTAIAVYGAKWLFAFLCVGLAEEYFFRGYIQFALERGAWGLAERMSARNTRAVAFWCASVITSLIFALTHSGNPGENPFGLLQVFIAGMVFAYMLWWTGSLWWGVGFHMAWDWAQSFLYGVPDSGGVSVGRLFITHPQGKPLLSGGSDGPEGSVLATVALLLTVVIVRRTARRGTQPALEEAPREERRPSMPLLHTRVP